MFNTKAILTSLLYVGSVFALSSSSASAQVTSLPMITDNAEAFLNRMSRGGGASNGGGPIVSEFYREGVVGIESLKFLLDAGSEPGASKISAIQKAMREAKVYFVNFRLCHDDHRSDCGRTESYAAKNYPKHKTILVDTEKWNSLSLVEKRRISTHEFAGIAGLELDNHYYTSRIDDREIYETFERRQDLRRYFQMMNDFYFALPSTPAPVFSGEWGKRTVLRPGKKFHSSEPRVLLKGEKYALRLSPHFLSNDGEEIDYVDPDTGALQFSGEWKGPEKIRVSIQDYSHTYQTQVHMSSGPETAVVITGDCLIGSIQSGVFRCDWPWNPKAHPKWKGKAFNLFKPSIGSEKLKGTLIPHFECKAIDENQLMCRQIYDARVPFSPVVLFKTHYEYVFYDRIKIPNP